MHIVVTRKTRFVPEWENNKDDPYPIEIEYLTPTTVLYNKLIPKTVVKFIGKGDGKGKEEESFRESEIVIDNDQIVQEMVKDVKNLSFAMANEDGKEEMTITIRKGSDFFKEGVPTRLRGLIDEIGTYLQGQLRETVDTKK